MKGTPTDRDSVRRVMRGDLDEFSRLVSLYSPRMLRLALGIVRRHDVAEDVVQDALVKAYEKLGSWRGESALLTWLYRIVYTTALSSLRRTATSASTELAADSRAAYLAGQTWHDDDDAGDWELTEENIVRMQHALELLSPLDRTLVNLFYLEDRSVRDVAAICGESEGNVKTRLHRARRQLRKLMNDREYGT